MKKIILICLIWGIGLMAPATVCADDTAARKQLERSINAILDILKDDHLRQETNTVLRREALREKIYERFDLERMSLFSLGRHWRGITPKQRQTFVALFSQLLEKSYVEKIESYTDEQVMYVKELVRGDKAQIDTIIVTDSIEIPIDYRMYQTDDGEWMVYDLVVEGVSLVANYRSQFTQMLDSGTFESLIIELEKKIESNS